MSCNNKNTAKLNSGNSVLNIKQKYPRHAPIIFILALCRFKIFIFYVFLHYKRVLVPHIGFATLTRPVYEIF